MKYLARLWAQLIAVVLDRPLRVRMPGKGKEAWFYPAENVVLPVMAGGAPEDGEDDDKDADKDGDGDADKDDDKDADADKDKDGEGGSDDDADKDKSGDSEWKGHARRHEREAKKARKRAKELEEELKQIRDKDKTEQERALEKARDEARAEAKTEFDKSLRSGRLEVAVTRLASKGVKVGEGDDAKTERFADSEDALVHIERAIDKGDIDPEDIFDSEGKVKVDALTSELAELLDSKPHLVAKDGSEEKPKKKTADGEVDTGKGRGTPGGDLEDLSPEELYKRTKR